MEITWREVLEKFAAAIQKHDRGKYICEMTCRNLFYGALPEDVMKRYGVRIIPKRLVMRHCGLDAENRTVDGSTVEAVCLRIALAETHPLYVAEFSKAPKKVAVAEDTIRIRKVEGIWTPQGDRLDSSFEEEMRLAEKRLFLRHYTEFFEPALKLSKMAEKIGLEALLEVYEAVQTIEAFTPKSAKCIMPRDILGKAEAARSYVNEKIGQKEE